jgi:hypothetical protein
MVIAKMATFTTIPPELRIPIYAEVLQTECPTNAWYSLLLACRTVHDEVTPLLPLYGHLYVRIPSMTTLVAARYVENAQNKDEPPNPDILTATLAYFNRFAVVTLSVGVGSFRRPFCNPGQAQSALNTFETKILAPCLQSTSPHLDAKIPRLAVDHHVEPYCCWHIDEFPNLFPPDARMSNDHPFLLWWNAYWADHGKIFEELRQLRHHVPTYQNFKRLPMAVLCFEAVRRKREVYDGVKKRYCQRMDQWLCVGSWDIP